MSEHWTQTAQVSHTQYRSFLLDSLSGVSKSLLEVCEVRVIGSWWRDDLQQAWTQLCRKPDQKEVIGDVNKSNTRTVSIVFIPSQYLYQYMYSLSLYTGNHAVYVVHISLQRSNSSNTWDTKAFPQHF